MLAIKNLKNLLQWIFFPSDTPIPFVPFNRLREYTMGSKAIISYWYFNGFQKFSKPNIYTKRQINLNIEKIKKKETFYYGKTDLWLYEALEKFSINGKQVAIMGSVKPTYESICLFYKGQPTTIEYNKIIMEDKRVAFMTVDECERSGKKFDAAFSISSFEHDGLGRYGDPLNPEGDLLAMAKMKNILKPKGLLFLAVPIGRDELVWNAHRVYGKYRLPLLLKNWEVVEKIGFSEGSLNVFNTGCGYQPIFVLRN